MPVDSTVVYFSTEGYACIITIHISFNVSGIKLYF